MKTRNNEETRRTIGIVNAIVASNDNLKTWHLRADLQKHVKANFKKIVGFQRIAGETYDEGDVDFWEGSDELSTALFDIIEAKSSSRVQEPAKRFLEAII